MTSGRASKTYKKLRRLFFVICVTIVNYPHAHAGGPKDVSEIWNFSRGDLIKLRQNGGELHFSARSSWLPEPLRRNILLTIKFALSSGKTFSSSNGVNTFDFFHGHIGCRRKDVLPPNSSISALSAEYQRDWAYSIINREFKHRFFSGAAEIKPESESIEKYVATVLEVEKLLTPGLNEVLKSCGDLNVIYHTNEYDSELGATDPRRNIVTDLSSQTPKHFNSLVEGNASSWSLEYEPVLNIAFLVDRSGTIHVTYGFISELSSVTGYPLERPTFVKKRWVR